MTTERPRGWDESLLDELATELEWPRTPDLRGPVVAALATQLRPSARPWARPALAVAVAAVLALALLLAVEPARTAVAEFFGLVEGERIEFLPTPPPGVSPTPLPSPVGLQEIGAPSTLAELPTQVLFEPALPGGFGLPEGVFVVYYESAPVAVLQYERFDLWQARLTTFGYFGKGVPPGTVIEELQIRGRPAYWIESGGHIVRFFTVDGREVAGSQRTVDRRTLVWSSLSTTYRIETDVPLEDALAIAESLP